MQYLCFSYEKTSTEIESFLKWSTMSLYELWSSRPKVITPEVMSAETRAMSPDSLAINLVKSMQACERNRFSPHFLYPSRKYPTKLLFGWTEATTATCTVNCVNNYERGFSFERRCVLCRWEIETIINHMVNKVYLPRSSFRALALGQSESG